MKKTPGVALLACQLLSIAGVRAAPARAPMGRVAYLQGGDVWVAKIDGQDPTRLTTTRGKVETYVPSPDQTYLAYSKILEYVDEPGLYADDEAAPKIPRCSIVVMHVSDRAVVQEVLPNESYWIHPDRWLPEGTLLCHESSGFDVSGYFKLDPINATNAEFDDDQAAQLDGADITDDGAFVLYVDDSGLGESFRTNLHRLNLKTQADTILFSRRSLLDPRLSHDRKSVAYVDVSEHGGKYDHELRIYDIAKGESRSYATHLGVGTTDESEHRVDWSADDRYVSLFQSPEALLINVQKPSDTHRIEGTEFCWSGNRSIVFSQGDDLFTYDVVHRTRRLFVAQASKPRCLAR